MLTIRTEQMAVFVAAQRQDFVRKLTTHLLKEFREELTGALGACDEPADFKDAPPNVEHIGNLPVLNKGDEDLVFTLQSITFENPEFSIVGAPATVTITPNGTTNLRIRFLTIRTDIPCETKITIPSNTAGAPRSLGLSVYAT
jgi:hypothetical protein